MSAFREAVEQYPLAGHHGHCAKVVNGSVTAACTCGWEQEREQLRNSESAAAIREQLDAPFGLLCVIDDGKARET